LCGFGVFLFENETLNIDIFRHLPADYSSHLLYSQYLLFVLVHKIIILLALIIIKDRKNKRCERIERLFYDDEITTLDERREEEKKDDEHF